MPSTNPEAPTPDPGPQPLPPTTVPPMPEGPVCGACGNQAIVNWRRRPTEQELADLIATEQARRDDILRLADPQLPAPDFPPLPTAADTTRTVYACAGHAIGMDAATRIHQGTCTAPNKAGVNGCDCTPEPLPQARNTHLQDLDEARLPEHWVTTGDHA